MLSHCAKPTADLNLFPCHSEPFTTHFNVTLGFKPFAEQRGNVLINNVTNLWLDGIKYMLTIYLYVQCHLPRVYEHHTASFCLTLNSYLVLICDAKTLSPKKDEELFWTLDWLHALIWHLTLYKRCMGVWKWLPKELVSPLVPKKEDKLFLTLDCLNVLIRCLTLET